MKKAAKKAVQAKAKAKTALKTKAKPPVKAAKKTKAAPKKKAAAPKTKAVAKKTAPPAKAKAVAKSKPAVKKVSPPKSAPVAKKKPAAAPATPPRIAPQPAPASLPTAVMGTAGRGTPESPWLLKTPAGFSEFQAYRDETASPPALVVKVGSTDLRYDLRCIVDLHEMLKGHGDWKLLGSADEQQPVVEDTVESWARSPSNPVGGYYGLKPGLRGRFATYVPQVLEALGLAEVEHFPNNNRMRAK